MSKQRNTLSKLCGQILVQMQQQKPLNNIGRGCYDIFTVAFEQVLGYRERTKKARD